MKKYLLPFISGIVLLVMLKFLIEDFTYGKFSVKEIRKGYEGVIVDIYSTREMISPTFLKIKTEDGVVNTSVNSDVIQFSSIGDSVFKKHNDNVITIIKKTNQEKKFYLIEIDEKLRNHKNFPKEWKNKWLSPLNLKN